MKKAKNQQEIISNCKKCQYNIQNKCIMRDMSIEDTQYEPCIYFEKKKINWKSFLLGGISSLIVIKILQRKGKV